MSSSNKWSWNLNITPAIAIADVSQVDWFTINLPRLGPLGQIANITALQAD